jgi:hypothetical protein
MYVSKIARFAQDSLGESWKARNSRSEKLKHSTTEKLWFAGKPEAQDLSSGFSFSVLQRYILFGGFYSQYMENHQQAYIYIHIYINLLRQTWETGPRDDALVL